VNTGQVLVGIAAGDRINQGNFFRLTFGPLRRLGLKVELFSFQSDIQSVFDSLDAADGLAQPVSDLAVAPGQESAVFDVLVRPAAIGITAADLANYLNELRFGIELTSMTPIDVAAVQGGAGERSDLQAQLDAASKARDPFKVFGSYAKYLEWILILLLVVALLYFGEKAVRAVRRVA
jgi:hypothetical protein